MEKLVQLLLKFDSTGDRRISLPALVRALKVVDASLFDDHFVQGAFGGAGDGLVDIPGFAAWVTGKSEHKGFVERPEEQDLDDLDLDTSAVDSMLSQAKAKFEELDTNHNGCLDAKELKELCTWSYTMFGRRFKNDKEKNASIEKQVKRYLKQGVDWDFDTFEAYYLKLTADIEKYEAKRSEAFEKGYTKSKASDKFKELDTDGSGFLEGAELEIFATWIFESFQPDGKPLPEEKKQEEARKLVDKLMKRRDEGVGNADGKLSFTEVDFYIEEKIGQIEEFKKRAKEREAKRQAKEAEKKAAKEAKKNAKQAENALAAHATDVKTGNDAANALAAHADDVKTGNDAGNALAAHADDVMAGNDAANALAAHAKDLNA